MDLIPEGEMQSSRTKSPENEDGKKIRHTEFKGGVFSLMSFQTCTILSFQWNTKGEFRRNLYKALLYTTIAYSDHVCRATKRTLKVF